MSEPTRENASFLQKLKEESGFWEKDGLISAELRESILHRYDTVTTQESLPTVLPPDIVHETPATQEFPLYIRVVLALGVLLIGLAAFLLISFNWQHLTGAAKLSIVGGVLAAAHLGGVGLRASGWRNWAEAAFFFAGIMYGVGIWQIGQVFHLPADYPMGFWLWGLGVFLMAIVLGSTVLHLLAVTIIGIWMGVDLTSGFNLRLMNLYGLIPFHATSLPVIALLGFGIGLLRKERVAPALYVLLLLFWWVLQGVFCGLEIFLTFHVAAVGLICLAISTGLQTRNFAHSALGNLGILLIFGGLLVPSFLGCWDELLYCYGWTSPRYGGQTGIFPIWTSILPVIDLLLLVAAFQWTGGRSGLFERMLRNPFIVTFTIFLFVLWFGSSSLATCVFKGAGRSYVSSEQLRFDLLALGGMFLANAMIVTLTIWLIRTGLRNNLGGWFWSGVLFFLLWAIIRYVDLFSGFGGMLGAATIFMSCGLFMLGIVYVWSRRNRNNETDSSETTERDSIAEEPDRLEPLRERFSFLWRTERRVLIAAMSVALLQFGVLGTMIANEMRPHLTGTTIHVSTVPVDPRDLFRGDYVILRYEFSSLGSVPGGNSIVDGTKEQTVFVKMEQDGDVWAASGISRSRPKDGVFLRGTVNPYGNEIVYGIESYFVQEGTGKAIEDAMRIGENRVIVELNVAPNGKASIETVDIDPKKF